MADEGGKSQKVTEVKGKTTLGTQFTNKEGYIPGRTRKAPVTLFDMWPFISKGHFILLILIIIR